MAIRLATKGIIYPRPDGDDAGDVGGLREASKGLFAFRPIVIVEIPPDFAPGSGVGSGSRTVGATGKTEYKKIKVTVLFSGEIATQELTINSTLSVKAQVLDIISGITNPIFITVRHKS